MIRWTGKDVVGRAVAYFKVHAKSFPETTDEIHNLLETAGVDWTLIRGRALQNRKKDNTGNNMTEWLHISLSVVCTFNDAVGGWSRIYWMLGWLVNNEMQRIAMQSVILYFVATYDLRRSRKPTKWTTIADVPAEIRTEYFHNRSHKLCCLSQLLGEWNPVRSCKYNSESQSNKGLWR